MSDYIKKTWKDGEVITAEGLNNMETGIAEAKKAAEQAAGAASKITPDEIGAAKETHAAQHAAGGADPLTPDAIGAASADLSNVPESVLANLGGLKAVTGSFTVTPQNGVAATYTLTHNLGVKPKLIVIGNADGTAYRSLTLIDGNGNHSNSFGKAFCYGVNFYATTNPPQAAVTVSENDIIFSYKCEQASYAKTATVQYTLVY